jgi:hypothetical protein
VAGRRRAAALRVQLEASAAHQARPVISHMMILYSGIFLAVEPFVLIINDFRTVVYFGAGTIIEPNGTSVALEYAVA